MAGLGRVQQLFNRAVLGTIATLIGFARGGRSAAESLVGNKHGGHPLLAKLIKHNPPNANAPGRDYPGYCSGQQETARRYVRMNQEAL
jgi:hypothetical protein